MKKKKKFVRKKSRSRRHLVRQLPGKWKIAIIAAASVMFICTFCIFYVVLGSYDGLGMKEAVSENAYDMDYLMEKDGRLYYDDGVYHSIAGIDVSYYQKEIDWEKVKNDGIDFVMIRLGYRGYEEGNLMMDSRFKENLKGAKKAGLSVGVYFFSQAVTTEEAVAEAKYVIRHIRGRGITLPVVFDMEPIEGADRITGLTSIERTAIADAFCQVVQRNGYQPMIYGNSHWLTNRLELEYLTKYDIWLAHYSDSTDYPYEFMMWQYSDQGRVDGIKGDVDMDLLFVKKAEVSGDE